jgi:hypothetical protein
MEPIKPFFTTAAELRERIADYFESIKGIYHIAQVPVKNLKEGQPQFTSEKVCDREEQMPTISGLAYHIGFATRKAFDKYEATGKYARPLKRAKLRIEAEYEKKLHNTSSTGAIFALKSMGWNDKDDLLLSPGIARILKIEVTHTGPEPASSEKDVEL